jgi:LysR family hydrogen peroxide-inducible transcriptional activator
MNLRDLQYICAIAQHGSFSAAAQVCNVSQPALSNQVKKLERELGVELFLRLSGEVRPTECGQRILIIARDLLIGAQKIRDTAAEYNDPEAVPLNLGVTPTLAPYLARYLAQMFETIFPDMRIVLQEVLPDDMLSKVMDRTLDVALVAQSNSSPDLDFTALWDEPLLLGMRRGHPLETRASIAAEDVPEADFIQLPHSFGYALEARLPKLDPLLRRDSGLDLTGTRFETVCRHICNSDKYTIVPALASEQFAFDNWPMSFVPFEGPGNLRRLGAVSRLGCPRKPVLVKIGTYIANDPPRGVTPLFGRDAG